MTVPKSGDHPGSKRIVANSTRQPRQRLLDIVFGYDYFISYSHRDGLNYPRQLSERLKASGFSVFLDKEIYGGGDDLNTATRRRVRMSTYLVVIARDGAMNESHWVVEEVRECLAAKRTPIVIDINDAFEKASGDRPLKDLLASRLFIDENQPVEDEGAYDGEPSDHVVEELRRGFKAMRKNALRLQIMTLLAIILAALTLASLWLYLRADTERLAARAASLDVAAAQQFAEARASDLRRDIESERYVTLMHEYAVLKNDVEAGESSVSQMRLKVLEDEINRARHRIDSLRLEAKHLRELGKQKLVEADEQWKALHAKWFFATAPARTRTIPPNIFSIEVLNAYRSECLILHYGEIDNPKFILIDGGDQVLREALTPRLKELKERWSNEKALPLEMIILSQSDFDRIEAINDLTDSMLQNGEVQVPELQIGKVWFNHFIPITEAFQEYHFQRVPQKWRLAANLRALGIPVNLPFQHFVARPETGAVRVEVAGGLTITVLNPTPRWISQYQDFSLKAWKKSGLHVQLVPPAESDYSRPGITAIPSPENNNFNPLPIGSLRERSVVNLASLVLMFEYGDSEHRKRFLYSGDARADQIVAGLHEAGYLDVNGKVEVDLLHIPHYASDQNVSEEFFKRVSAKNYVITGDGTHHNPEPKTMNMIFDARQNDQYFIHFSHRIGFSGAKVEGEPDPKDLGTLLDRLFVESRASGRKYERVFRAADANSLIINLLEPVRY
jgi:hypothetical protein